MISWGIRASCKYHTPGQVFSQWLKIITEMFIFHAIYRDRHHSQRDKSVSLSM